MSFNELSILLAPSAGLRGYEENGFSAVSLLLILSKVETREGEAFPFPVSFSSDRWREHPVCLLSMLSKLDRTPVLLFAGKGAEEGVCPICLFCGIFHLVVSDNLILESCGNTSLQVFSLVLLMEKRKREYSCKIKFSPTCFKL